MILQKFYQFKIIFHFSVGHSKEFDKYLSLDTLNVSETLRKAHTIQMNFKFQEKYKMSRTTTKYQSSAWMLSMFLFPLNSWEKFQYAKSCKFSIDLLLE